MGVSISFWTDFGTSMGLNEAERHGVSTPVLSSSRDRGGGSRDRNVGAAHRVGSHNTSEEGVEPAREEGCTYRFTQEPDTTRPMLSRAYGSGQNAKATPAFVVGCFTI